MSGSRDKADAGRDAGLCPVMTHCGHWVLDDYRHDGAPSNSIQVARQDSCVLRRSKCALTVRNGRWSSFSIANQTVSFDSSQQSMPNRKMWLNCLWDDRRFVRHLGNVR